MPFGLRNAAQSFQRFMDQVLRDLNFAYAYTDDVLIASSSHDEHVTHLHTVLRQFSDIVLLLIQANVSFGVSQITFLGHLVDSHGICPLLDKVEAPSSFPRPSTQRKLREFFGLINFIIILYLIVHVFSIPYILS